MILNKPLTLYPYEIVKFMSDLGIRVCIEIYSIFFHYSHPLRGGGGYICPLHYEKGGHGSFFSLSRDLSI